ncbi:hypothetical protein SMC26_08435 [Actinomadura fulvescens]
MMLPEIARRRAAVEALAAELEGRGWHTEGRGVQMWVCAVPLGPGREVGAYWDRFVWRRGSYVGADIAPVDDMVAAADLICQQLPSPQTQEGKPCGRSCER